MFKIKTNTKFSHKTRNYDLRDENPMVRKNGNIRNPLCNLNHDWVKAIKLILPSVNILHGYSGSRNLSHFVNLVNNNLTHKGEPETIRLLKAYRLSLQQYVLKQELTLIPYHSIDKDGFPRKIKWLKPKARSLNGKRYAVSVLRIIELFKCKPSQDYSTITNPPTCKKERVNDIIKFIPKSRILRKIPKVLSPSYLPLSNKAGPNGPATICAVEDMTALRREPKQYFAVTRLLNQSNLSWLNYDAQEPLLGTFLNAKTIPLSDRACKTRQISILGWWTNAALSGIHKTWMNFLKDLHNDLTFKQETIPNRIKGLGTNLFSSDMTAFTDRFPREILVAMLEHCHGSQISIDWNTIMSETKFLIPSGSYIKYRVGNPMGVLSSWPVSTGGHHLIKEYVHYKLRIRKHKYLILGDDSAINRKKVLKYYRKVIKELGISISQPKSTSSHRGYVEFAKRLFGPEAEYTGLPVYLLKNLHKNPEQLLELVKMMRERGYNDSIIGPVVLNLLDLPKFNKIRKVLIDILSLSERVSGFKPLYEIETDILNNSTPEKVSGVTPWSTEFNRLPADYQDKYLEYSQDTIFWETVRKLNLNSPNTNAKGAPKTVRNIKPTHPLVFALNAKLEGYLDGIHDSPDEDVTTDVVVDDFNMDFNEFSIYDAWMRGEYRYLARLPSIDTYEYNTIAHKVTKCKYEVLKKAISLLKSDDTSLFLNPTYKTSDEDLYEIGFGNLQKAFRKP